MGQVITLHKDMKDVWRYYPDTYAAKASGGKWKNYAHTKYISRIISPGLIHGGGRYIIELPPRHGKSEFVSNWVPTWYLDTFQDRKVILASYAAKFAQKWGRKVRTNLENNPLTNAIVRQDSRAADRFLLTEGGQMITAGIGGPITGEGANLGIIDDPIKNWQEAMSATKRSSHIDWFLSTYYTRLEPNATIILLMTRWHEEDLAGFLLNEHEDDWTEIRLPALAEENDPLGRPIGEALCPDRYDTETMKKIMKGAGTRVSQSLYQQHPRPVEGEHWKRSYWRYWQVKPDRFDVVIQSWDLTFKDKAQSKTGKVDYVVGQVWGKVGANLYLLDQVRGQWGFTKTKQMIYELTRKWPDARRKLIEDKANGAAVQDDLKNEISGLELVEPRGGKLARVTACEPTIEAGNVYLPDPKLFPWVKDFIEEAASFGPQAKNDDQVDTASQAILKLDGGISDFLRKMTKR